MTKKTVARIQRISVHQMDGFLSGIHKKTFRLLYLKEASVDSRKTRISEIISKGNWSQPTEIRLAGGGTLKRDEKHWTYYPEENQSSHEVVRIEHA